MMTIVGHCGQLRTAPWAHIKSLRLDFPDGCMPKAGMLSRVSRRVLRKFLRRCLAVGREENSGRALWSKSSVIALGLAVPKAEILAGTHSWWDHPAERILHQFFCHGGTNFSANSCSNFRTNAPGQLWPSWKGSEDEKFITKSTLEFNPKFTWTIWGTTHRLLSLSGTGVFPSSSKLLSRNSQLHWACFLDPISFKRMSKK